MDAGLLFARLVFGTLMAIRGSQKLFGWFGGYGLGSTGGFFETLGFRPGGLFAFAAGLTEFGGGLFLAIGLFEPAAAAAIVSVMIVAMVTVHWRNGLLSSTNGVEMPLLYLAASACLALTGPGVFSIDAALGLTTWWTPELSAVLLAIGIVGGFGNLALRRRAPAVAPA